MATLRHDTPIIIYFSSSVKKILSECYIRAKDILVENRGLLDEISAFLLTKETITGEEFMAFVNADKDQPAEEESTEE